MNLLRGGTLIPLPSGRERYVYPHEDVDVRVGDQVLNCGAFLGRVLHNDGTTFDGEAIGTGFFASMKSSIEGKVFHYFVTCRHVVDGLAGSEPYIVLNRRGGGKQVILLGNGLKWWLHPTDSTADVAVIPFRVEPGYDVVSVGTEDLFLTPDHMERYKIGVGDEVFIIGLFAYASGQSRNMPIVRHGNIAMLPTEQIQTRAGYADVVLVEARSIGGLSGSPVFVRETLQVAGKDSMGQRAPLGGYGRIQLLGAMVGHWNILESEINKSVFTPPGRGQGVNMGIGIAVPAIKILETINQPELVAMRKEIEERERKNQLLPTEDSRRSSDFGAPRATARRSRRLTIAVQK